MFVGDVLNHEEEILLFLLKQFIFNIQDTSSWSVMASPFVEDVMNLENEVLLEELHEEEKVIADSITLENQDGPIVVSEYDLSNFSANVIHDMHGLGLLSAFTAA
jgi:hypothetical protein